MRIAIILGGTDQGSSGLGTYVRAVVPRLAAAVRVSGDELMAVGTPADFAAYGPQLDGVSRCELPAFLDRPWASALFHLVLSSAVARAKGADVLLQPAANRRATMGRLVPTVAVVHDLAQLHVREKYDAARMAYVRALVAGPLRAATSLVAVSRATQVDLARALHKDVAQIRVVPNGVETRRFRVMAAVPQERPYLLYVSRLEHPGKNHLRLLRAFARSKVAVGHDLVLVGPDWGAGAAIAEEARALGIAARVIVRGRVEDAELHSLLVSADAVVMVGLHEGFGLPALEALACGRPVLAANAGALPEVTGDLAALCDPLDEASIEGAIDRVLSDETLRRRAADEGPAWAARHDWDTCAASLLDACRRAARAA